MKKYKIKYEDTFEAWLDEEDKKTPGFKKEVNKRYKEWKRKIKKKNEK